MRRGLAASGLFVLQVAWASSVIGAPTLGPVREVTTGSRVCQQDPIPVPSRSGGFLVAWNYFYPEEVRLRAADPEGNLTTPEVSFPGRQLRVIGSDAAGDLTLVWQVAPRLGYRLQRLSATGQPLGPEVDLPLSGSPFFVTGAVAPDGSVAVVWHSDRRIAARWFSARGVALSPELEIVLYPASSFFFAPAATIDSAGRLVVAWSRPAGNPVTRMTTVYRRFDPDGTAEGPEVEVSGDALPPANELAPVLAPLRDGGIAVSWRRAHENDPAWDLLLRRFDGADQPVGDLILADTRFDSIRQLVSDGDDRLALIGAGPDEEVPYSYGLAWMQLQTGTAAPEPAIRLHPERLEGSYPEIPAALFLTTGRIAALWQAWYDPGILPTGCEDVGIFERIVDTAPAIQPPQPVGPEILLSESSPSAGVPQIARAPGGGWIALWQQGANGPVVSRAFDAAGQALGPEVVLTEAAPKAVTYDLSIASLPAGGFVAAWLDFASSGPASIRRLGADGQPAGAAVSVPLSAGARKVRVASGGSGFLLAWLQRSTGVLEAQRFQAGDAPAGAPFVLAQAGGPVQDFDLEAHPGGGFVLAWAGSDTEIFARRLDAAGASAGPDLLASSGDLLQALPRLAIEPDGGFAVAWGAVLPSFRFVSGVRLRRFGPDGSPRSEVIEVQSLVATFEDDERALYAPDLASAPNGMLWVLLKRIDDTRQGLFGLAVVDGVPVGPPVEIAKAQDIESASLVADGCNWTVIWNAHLRTQSPTHARRFTGGCQAGPQALLLGDRFRAEIAWRTRDGKSGTGQALPLTNDSGAFWFFGPDNLELMLKVLDGRAVNGAFWVFYATLTDVAFDLRITDTLTGAQKVYSKPAGRLESRADLAAFPAGPAPAAAPPSPARWLAGAASAAPATEAEGCATSETVLCLGGHFRVRARFVDPRDGVERQAITRALTRDSGSFWFFGPDNLELMLKIVDGRPLNHHFWFFAAGLSNVHYEITVTDTRTGLEKVYVNERGSLASRADTAAFGE